jgi:hypothetical protein
MIEEKEKQKALVERVKRHIKYLEKNDPNHVTLKLLKERISDYISEEVENLDLVPHIFSNFRNPS